MRFHIPGLPGQPVTRENSACAFTQKVRRFATMMGDEHEVWIYGDPRHDDLPVVEYVECYPETEPPLFNDAEWSPFNLAAAAAIRERAEPQDFVLMIGGNSQASLCVALPEFLCVEFGIGYGGTYSPYRVWESYAWMHTCYGAAQFGNPNAADGFFFDAVIPAYFDPEDFPFREDKDDYLVFVGRLTERKGVKIAEQAAEDAGLPLMIAGQGDYQPTYGEVLGHVGPDERGELVAGARALLAPTTYIEPFGCVAVEAMFCGTPAITTDWGAFSETVAHGLSGYRCRSRAEFRWAVENADALKPKKIRAYAKANYAVNAIRPLYEAYFEQLATLWGEGWNSPEQALDRVNRYQRRSR